MKKLKFDKFNEYIMTDKDQGGYLNTLRKRFGEEHILIFLYRLKNG